MHLSIHYQAAGVQLEPQEEPLGGEQVQGVSAPVHPHHARLEAGRFTHCRRVAVRRGRALRVGPEAECLARQIRVDLRGS